MKIRIEEILETKQPWRKNNYTKYGWVVNAITDKNQKMPAVTVVTFSSWVQRNMKPDAVWTVNRDEYKGYVSYIIQEKKPLEQKTQGRPPVKKIHIEKYDNMVRHCWDLSKSLDTGLELTGEDISNIFEKILACATVIVDPETIHDGVDKKIDQATQQLNSTLPEVSDDEIPF